MGTRWGAAYWRSPSMDRKVAYLIAGIVLSSVSAHAQKGITAPSEKDVYCAGIVTTEAPAKDFYVISGPESSTRVTYQQGDVAFINHGAAQGVKVGDEFQVTRAVNDAIASE